MPGVGRVVAETMTVELGRYGFWRRQAGFTPALARAVEALGFGALWVGGSPPADLTEVEGLLAATDQIAVATGIVNMWASPAAEVAASYHRIAARYPGRFLLGVGIGHPEATREYATPYRTIVDYLDVLDEHGVPVADRALAALRPKALAVAAERTAGTHPYLTTPDHTRIARQQIGPGVLLAPEQTAAVDAPDRAAARIFVRRYLGLRNYVANLRTLGFTDDDLADGGSDDLVDALVTRGDAAAVAARLDEHLAAGADHVCVQLLGDDDVLPALRGVAEALGLRS
jgi:probable F420-dependent oxidoreductase